MPTEVQAIVSAAIEQLKLETQPSIPGSPLKHKLTDQTMVFLQRLADEGKLVVVDHEGAITID